jgi:hypothetical protein
MAGTAKSIRDPHEVFDNRHDLFQRETNRTI